MGVRLRKLLVSVITLCVLIVVILLIAPLFVPAGLYKDKVMAKIQQSTGRTLDIRGDIGLRFVPHVQLNMGDAHLSNPGDFGEAPHADMIALQELQLSLDLSDLLQGDVTIDTLQLVNPVIYLGRNKKGEANWVFTPAVNAKPSATADSDSQGTATFKGGLSLPNIEISNGTVIYQATPQAQPISLNNLNARIKMPSLHDQLTIYADTRLNDVLPAQANIRLNTLGNWLDGKESSYDINLTIDNNLLEFTSNGTAEPSATTQQPPAIKGDMRLAVASINKLSAGLGYPLLQQSSGEGKVALRSMFNYAGQKAKLLGVTLRVDDTAISGSGSLDLSSTRPMLTAEISTADTLVLDRFMNKQKPTIERETKPSTETANTPASTGTAWSKAPLLDNTNVLKALDAKLAISIGGLKADKITLGAMKVATSLSNGNLSINIPKFDFYGGTATTSVSVQPLGEHSLRISKNASVNNADIGEFLRHAAEFDRLDGRGNLTLSFTTQGISQDDFVNQLNGNGTLALKNGSIKGFNLAEIVRDAQEIVKSVKNKDITANMGNSASGAETDFSSLNASYTVNKGIINNPDLALQAPLLNLTGSGTVNLPQQTVNYRLKPTIVGSIEGEGRTQKTTGGLAIPMRVSGTFEQLKFTPDAQGLVQEVIKDPKGTLKNMEDNVRGLRDDVKSLFKGL